MEHCYLHSVLLTKLFSFSLFPRKNPTFSVLFGKTWYQGGKVTMNTTVLVLAIFLVSCSITHVALGCDCSYKMTGFLVGGCHITSAPAEGWKCKCSYKGAWTCGGSDYQCESYESCPGNCYSRICCAVGGGDCGGYS